MAFVDTLTNAIQKLTDFNNTIQSKIDKFNTSTGLTDYRYNEKSISKTLKEASSSKQEASPIRTGADNYDLFSNDTSSNSNYDLFEFNHNEAQLARDWQTEMSNTAHQREVADLKAAGLNPILSANGGAASYTASTASSQSSLDIAKIQAAAQIQSAKIAANSANAVARIYSNTDYGNNLLNKGFDFASGLAKVITKFI